MCGVVGVFGHRDASQLAYLGLFALQHRGQESAGIVTADGENLRLRVGMGLASEVFDEGTLRELTGRSAVGHVRYATTGASHLKNAQPLTFNHVHGPIAIAHNGNLTNAGQLRKRLEERGAIFQSSTDSEVIVHLIARAKGPVEDAIIHSLRQVVGAYSLLFLAPDKLIAARDPFGFRPLVLGKLGRAFVVASETTALNLMGARTVREIEPGEILILEGSSARSLKPFGPPISQAKCVFEQVYFARPDSTVFGRSVQGSRRELGRELAKEMPGVTADIVVPVPDSGVPAALGFAQESGIPFETGFVRSHYVGRTFIQPSQVLRDSSVALKLSPVPETLRGKRIVLVDDSIVRGTTSRKICRMLRRVGVKEIHMAISSPPIVSPCYYGIDTPRESELIAARHSREEVRRFLGVDSLHHLSVEGMVRAAGSGQDGYCAACFTRRYPTPVPDLA
ncbi:MAG: amidophosphoribosyltransferase [Elusimicrobia bacterium]|nr:amidophosphoribosyltransferase [Elusimicrobiota bacterium]